MFYSQELATFKKHGLATVWLAATVGSKSRLRKLSKQEIVRVNVQRACHYLQKPPEPLALRLSSNLLVGISRVYDQQLGYYVADVNRVWAGLRTSLSRFQDEDLLTCTVPEGPGVGFKAITIIEEDLTPNLGIQTEALCTQQQQYFLKGYQPPALISTESCWSNIVETLTHDVPCLSSPSAALFQGDDLSLPFDPLAEDDQGLPWDFFGIDTVPPSVEGNLNRRPSVKNTSDLALNPRVAYVPDEAIGARLAPYTRKSPEPVGDSGTVATSEPIDSSQDTGSEYSGEYVDHYKLNHNLASPQVITNQSGRKSGRYDVRTMVNSGRYFSSLAAYKSEMSRLTLQREQETFLDTLSPDAPGVSDRSIGLDGDVKMDYHLRKRRRTDTFDDYALGADPSVTDGFLEEIGDPELARVVLGNEESVDTATRPALTWSTISRPTQVDFRPENLDNFSSRQSTPTGHTLGASYSLGTPVRDSVPTWRFMAADEVIPEASEFTEEYHIGDVASPSTSPLSDAGPSHEMEQVYRCIDVQSNPWTTWERILPTSVNRATATAHFYSVLGKVYQIQGR
ncbi:R8 protein [Dispira parvispora]|uniref:R8 protein n=1 Tax=Dispira parvispora TaxID=1520584 RepID=A0A9W8B0N5_9FUNG|nr:R8 protein [Dispira parvispora]